MSTTETPANKKHGYKFGCDGVIGYKKAMHLLDLSSRDSLRRLAEAGLIRKGNHAGGSNAKAIFCRRSIAEYLDNQEN